MTQIAEVPVLPVVGIFVTFLLSFAGSLTPTVLTKFKPAFNLEGWWLYRFLNGLAGGLVLSVGYIHSLPDAFATFSELFPEPTSAAQSYTWLGLIALVGSLAALAIEEMVHEYSSRHAHPKQLQVLLLSRQNNHDAFENGDEAESLLTAKNQDGASSSGDLLDQADGEVADKIPDNQEQMAQMLVLLAGLSFHSFFIGISMGLEVNDLNLFIAIVAHQYFEGVAMGGRILQAKVISACARWSYHLSFSLSCPLGTSIGVLVHQQLAYNDRTIMFVDGIFQAFSGGILVYVALAHLLNGHHDDNQSKKHQHQDMGSRVLGVVSILTGVAIMAVIGIWA